MSDEEKEIIKFLKTFVKTNIDYCSLEKNDVLAILNLIEKQSKEIEELKEKNSKAIGHIEACKTSLGNYILSPNETEYLLEILKEE